MIFHSIFTSPAEARAIVVSVAFQSSIAPVVVNFGTVVHAAAIVIAAVPAIVA